MLQSSTTTMKNRQFLTNDILFCLLPTHFNKYKPSCRSAVGLLVPAACLSALVSYAAGVTSRFWLARRRPSPLFPPAAGLRSLPAARACRLTLARPSVSQCKPHA